MRRTIRARLRRPWTGREQTPPEGEEFVEIDASELTGVFSAPQWLRDLGLASWLLVGVAAFLAGAVWLLALTQTIVVPVIVAAIIASVVSPAIDWLERRGLPRAVGVVSVFVALIALGIGVGVLTVAGIANESGGISSHLQGAVERIAGWLKDIGVDPSTADSAKEDVSASVSSGFKALLEGLASGIDRLAGLAVFLSFTVLSLFFMLKDAPVIGAFVRRHMGVPEEVARTITGRTTNSLQGYFVGMTIVSLFSATIVGLGALVLGVDLPGTIAMVTFLGGFVPYLGAWAAGVFAVLIALGSSGPETAGALAVIVLLANGVLQQMVQPVAYGATLGIHPLAVLIVTIAGGSMFGTIGLILAAPLTAAAVRISADLARARSELEPEQETGPEPTGPARPEASPSSA
jgi:predicted PurR-regulated permease PerM